MPFGGDFVFADLREAQDEWQAMELVMSYMREYLDVEVHFSTASEFFDQGTVAKTKLRVYEGDFVPYAELRDEKVYATGFYSSRP